MSSLTMLAIKPKTMRDLLDETPFTRADIITIQDPENLAARDLSGYDYVKGDKKVEDLEMKNDPLRGINVDAAGGASKVLKMIAQKVSHDSALTHARRRTETNDAVFLFLQTRESNAPASSSTNTTVTSAAKEGLIVARPKIQKAYNASNFTNGEASASFTSTALTPVAKNEVAMFDEEEYMFDEMLKSSKEKERLRCKGYATIQTSLGTINVELHGDRVSKSQIPRSAH